MSTTIGDTVDIRSCDWCDDKFQAGQSPREQHCSHDCFYNDKGQGALNQLESDHKLCATCFRYIKTVSTPEQSYLEDKADRVGTAVNHGGELYGGDDGELTLDATECSNTRHTAAQSIIGYQYPTQDTDYLYGNAGKWICSCGSVETNERDATLESIELEVTITNLCDRLSRLSRQGAVGGDFSKRLRKKNGIGNTPLVWRYTDRYLMGR